MTDKEFIEKLKIAASKKTLYVNGCFGAPMTASNKKRYTTNTAYNKKPERATKIMEATADTYGFDCVGLIKGILWGWSGTSAVYGGAAYGSHGVADISEDNMITRCNPSTDFSRIVPGAAVWIKGHIGVYIGDGQVIEASPVWKDGVQTTYLANLKLYPGKNNRYWTKWGKLPWIVYTEAEEVEEVKKLKVLCDGEIKVVNAINHEKENYIRVRDFDDILKLADVSYNKTYKMPEIKSGK